MLETVRNPLVQAFKHHADATVLDKDFDKDNGVPITAESLDWLYPKHRICEPLTI